MKVLYIKPKNSAVYNYRMDRPLKRLGAKGRLSLLRKNEEMTIQALAERFKKMADIWVIKYIGNRHTLDVLYTMRDAVGAKIVVDIDDNIWQIPAGSIMRKETKKLANDIILTTESVKEADWVTVSTEALKTILRPLNENIVVLPNLIDKKEWKWKRKPHKKVRIGWVYSQTHTPDIEEVREALEEIVAKYKDKVEIVVLGTDHDIFSFPTENIPPVKYTDYPKVLTEASLDISICPLQDNDFNRCKSNIKWLESTLAGAAVVASKVFPYEYSIKHGKTGYVCKGKNQWVRHLSNLIDNPDLRKVIVKDATEEVLKYDISLDKKWRGFYESIE